MFAIKNNITKEYLINKSKFIVKLYFIKDTDEAKKILADISIKYKDATHICYAYIVENTKRFSDDGEPSGTAGLPLLHVLETNNLDYVLAVVIRYFGGIKLGAGGLLRAYSNCLSSSIEKDNIGEIKAGIIIEISYDYDNAKIIEPVIKNYNIINRSFTNITKLEIEILIDDYQRIKDFLEKHCEIKEKKHLLIVK